MRDIEEMRLKESDLHYLRSILGQLRGLQSFLAAGPVPMPSLPGEALADNIDWLDCFIDKYKEGGDADR